ncbi:mucin-5AC [Manduca sexta]|uniref:mucin-5AC n=1 Tax=Manduca sexta TaxID=7130 RepID=UPI00188DD5CF|nr:mucin-5AC [Manduca sexta]
MLGVGRPTQSIQINSIIDLVKNKDVIESVEVEDIYSSQTPTPALGDDVIASIKPDAVKTYYTTYTFFTTIFVGSDANVCSRSEVYTNYVGPDALIPTKSNPLAVESTRAQFDFRNCKQIKMEPTTDTEHTSMETSVSVEDPPKDDLSFKKEVQPSPIEVDMLFSVESNPLESENSYINVKSSSSKGERQYLDNNNVLDDQISSESNIDEILPSPTLLLQTSYTTFTYFTTMYIGKDSSKVKSHLETITNVVTETIMPNKEPEDESNLPITYYTTFTYWTTLYKDKSTTITSREEIVSNVVTPSVLAVPTVSPIDTTPIEVDSVLPPKELEVELKPSLIVDDSSEPDDGKATFYTTYTYFTTFYAGNTSQIRSSLETVTNIVDNTKVVEDNQIARKVPSGSPEKNLIQDNGDKLYITPTVVKEEIQQTKLPDISSASPTVLLGTYIDNLYAEVKPATPMPDEEKKILFSQVAVISGDSTVVTSDNKTLPTDSSTSNPTTTTSSTENAIISSSPEIIEGTVTEPETTTEVRYEEEEDGTNTRKKSRLTFKPKKPSVTPVITPFSSRNRPTFIPKRVPLSNSATTITRLDVTPTITATPTLKSVRQSGFGGSRKQSVSPGSSSAGKRFSGRSGVSSLSGNVPSASRPGAFGRGSIQPTSRRGGFRSSTLRSNSLDYVSRSGGGRVIRPTATLRLPNSRGGRQSASITFPPDQNDETLATQLDENVTESYEEITEAPVRTTNNPLLRFRRPPVPRQPGTAITPRSTTQAARRGGLASRGRLTTTTRRSTTRSTPNPLLALRRQRPNSLFPRRNLFKQPEPEPEEEFKEEEQKLEDDEELLEEEEFEEDNDYDSSDRKERHVATPPPTTSRRTNIVSIRPFAFKRRSKRQADFGNRKYNNFRRPGKAGKAGTTRRPDPEPESEAPPATQKPRSGGRFNGKSRANSNTRTTTASAPKTQSRQPFIIRGESRTTSTTSAPAYRRGKTRTSSRTTTTASRPKAPRLQGKSSSTRSSPTRATTRSRTRTTTSKASSRQRSSFENFSGERKNNYANILNDGKITITHQIPTEVTIPVVNGKITEYKNVISATQSIETLLLNQVSTSLGSLGQPQLVLAAESTEIDPGSGATKVIKYLLNETPTTTVIFTPTTIRGRKTSYSHVLPSTVYNVEPVTQTIAPEINSNVPLANLLLSQLLLGNQQPAINPLLAFQGQGLLPQQQIVQTPVTEYKTRATTYVTTVTDARETVLPITFRGKAILTTIVDPTTNVITATEFVTETVITTPTAYGPGPQLNSLLLPLLLQQQQQQPMLNLQTANPLLGLGQPDLNLNNLNNLNQVQNNLNNDIFSNSPKPNVLSDFNSNEDFSDDHIDDNEDDSLPPPPTSRRSKQRGYKAAAPPPAPPKLTSVVTLYVSGKHPGEFSTVLSTVISDDTQTVRKREAIYYEDVKVSPTILPSVDELYSSQIDNSLSAIALNSERYLDNSSVENQLETQSLESVVGELSRHIRYDSSPTYVVDLGSPSAIRHIKQSSVDDIS